MIQDEWRPVEGFPKYSVNKLGQVRNDRTGLILRVNTNQYGVAYVGMMRENWQQYHRSLALLVAKAWLPERTEIFDTPINLDGDRLNCAVDNLMWRPRWFAVYYHQQFHKPLLAPEEPPIVEVESGRKFNTPMDACVTYGLLEKDVVLSIDNRTYVWPTYQMFDWQ